MLLYLAGLLSLSSLASGAHVEEEVQAPFSERTAWEVIANDPETSMWHDLVVKSGILEDSSWGCCNHTFFAPTNDAVQKFIDSWIHQGQGELTRDFLKNLIKLHFTENRWYPSTLARMKGNPVFAKTYLDSPDFVNLVNTSKAGNNVCKDGYGCKSNRQVISITCPKAYPAMPIVVNFGVPGFGKYTSRVISPAIPCLTAVVYKVDKVLSFPKSASNYIWQDKQLYGEGFASASHSVPDFACLFNQGPNVTIFVPKTASIEAAINGGCVDIGQMKTVLYRHVLPGRFFSTELKNQTVKTMSGESVDIIVSNPNVLIGGSRVVIPNIVTRNGVIHIVENIVAPHAAMLTGELSEW